MDARDRVATLPVVCQPPHNLKFHQKVAQSDCPRVNPPVGCTIRKVNTGNLRASPHARGHLLVPGAVRPVAAAWGWVSSSFRISGAAGWLVGSSASDSGRRRVGQPSASREQFGWLPARLGDDAAAVQNATRGPNKARTQTMSEHRIYFHESAAFLFHVRKIRLFRACPHKLQAPHATR